MKDIRSRLISFLNKNKKENIGENYSIPVNKYSFNLIRKEKSESVTIAAPDMETAEEMLKNKYPGCGISFLGQVMEPAEQD